MTAPRDRTPAPRRRGHPTYVATGTASVGAAGDVDARLQEAEETLRAIRNGEVDALVVHDESQAPQVFTLSSADRPYRIFVENMRDGAATVSESGIILYANRRLAEMLACPLGRIMGSRLTSFIADGYHSELRAISAHVGGGGTIDAELLATGGPGLAVRINTATLAVDSQVLFCLTFADLTQQNAQMQEIDRLGRAQAERMEELERAKAALTELASHDTLTGLPNRALLVDRLTQALALGARSGKSTGAIFVDVDHFKEINDTRGHAVGDFVLCQIADRLLAAVRPADSVARLAGDEFVVILPEMDSLLDAITVGSRIASVVAPPVTLESGTLHLTASIGIATADHGSSAHPYTASRLLQEADIAMYQAKSLGGARTELFDRRSAVHSLEGNRESWILRIRSALDEDRFVLHAQPIVDLATGEIVQHELLLRMRDGDGGLIPPLAFLPTAESCGLINVIDEWVIAQAVKIAGSGQTVAVNLSAPSAGDPRVLDLLERELSAHQADPAHLIFEITETALMHNMDRARRFAERLVGLGCRLALDDFGTGFASFTYLKQLPVRYLKIDIDFVRGLLLNPQDKALVSAIVSLARDFGQETIAEGVEDEPTAEALRELGVSFAQGYLFGRPAPTLEPTSIESSA